MSAGKNKKSLKKKFKNNFKSIKINNFAKKYILIVKPYNDNKFNFENYKKKFNKKNFKNIK